MTIGLTTSELNPYFPGLEALYGPGKPVKVQLLIESLKEFHSEEKGNTFSLYSDVGVKFFVGNGDTSSSVVSVDLTDLYINMTAEIKDMNVSASVIHAKFNTIDINSNWNSIFKVSGLIYWQKMVYCVFMMADQCQVFLSAIAYVLQADSSVDLINGYISRNYDVINSYI